MESNRVIVCVRIRPKLDGVVNALQTAERYEPMACSRYSDTSLRIWDGRTSLDSRTFSFAYDAVFDENASQEEVYDDLAMEAVDNVLSGSNSIILTYGQTGSGKTYTVLGGVRRDPVSDDIVTTDTGILLRALQDILHHAKVNENKLHVVLGISAVEIYLDEVRDLLSDEQTPTAVHMSLVKDIVRFAKLRYVPIRCIEDGLKVFKKATARRMQRMTSANDASSRSHAIFTIEVFQQPITPKNPQPLDLLEYLSIKETSRMAQLEGKASRMQSHPLFQMTSQPLLGEADAPVMHSKLSLVDLAGSEKVCNANVKGEGFHELKNINVSLSALGNVVRNLYEGSRHIPYRDSKLTTALRDFFAAPNARVVLIVNVNPTTLTVDETLSSLYFADKVKMMKPDLQNGAGGRGLEQDDMVCRYLSSIRKHDALLADIHIARTMHMFDVPQILRMVADDKNNVLYDLTFRLRKPECEIHRMAVSMMCEALKAKAVENDSYAAQQQKQMDEIQRSIRKELVRKWKIRWNTVFTHIQELLGVEEGDDQCRSKEEMLSNEINEASLQLKNASATHREIQKKHQLTIESAENTKAALDAMEKRLKSAEDALEDPTVAASMGMDPEQALVLKQEEESWTQISDLANRAIESASMRYNFSCLLGESQGLALELTEKKKQHQEATTSTSPPQQMTVYDWLRRALLGMAGNAVSLSIEQAKQLYRGEPDLFVGNPAFNNQVSSRPRQYWQLRPAEVSEMKKKRRGTRHDGEELLEDAVSFVRMGGEVTRFSRNGSRRRRLLYVRNRAGEEQLAWSSLGSLGCEGRIPLDAITKLSLGRVNGACDESSYYLCWSVVYQQQNSTSVLDLSCETVAELEAWIIGLSELTGLKPVFGEPMKIQPEKEPKWDALSEAEADYCSEWHIPPAVHIEAREQIMRRRNNKHRHSGLRLTPGELRNLVKLDIFRASAMWLHFFTEGVVTNPNDKLHCYIAMPVMPESIYLETKSISKYESYEGSSFRSIPVSSERREEP